MPVVIKQAEGSKVTPDTKPLIEEAKKLLAESKSNRRNRQHEA
jgi:hypothetical protein